MKTIITITLSLILFSVFAQEKGTFKDERDGKVYKTVKIGKQTWMAENLMFKPADDWWCYDNKPENCDKFGRLLGWKHLAELCPKGWHVPSKTEWEALFNNYGGEGPKAFSNLINGGPAGFNAVFGGSQGDVTKFYDNGTFGYYRTTTESKTFADFAWYVSFNSKTKMVIFYNDIKTDGVAVRCLKD